VRFIQIIIDGGVFAGEPGVATVLEEADTPNLDRLARRGRVGGVSTSPAGTRPSLGVGLLTLLGRPPTALGRVSPSVLHAAAAGRQLGERDWAMRAALVGVSEDDREGVMLGPADVSPDEAEALLSDLFAHWSDACPTHAEKLEIHDGHRPGERLLIDREGPDYTNVETAPPIAGEKWIERLPDGGDAVASERLCALISASRHFFRDHPVNAARLEQGLTPANMAWIWEPGTPADLLAHAGETGDTAIVTDAPEAIGVASLLGLTRAKPAGELDAVAEQASALSDSRGIVCVVPSPGEGVAPSAHVERIDRELVGPLLAMLEEVPSRHDPAEPGWRLLVTVTHEPGGGAVPFVLTGGWVRSVVERRPHEAFDSDLHVDPGHELREYMLRAGLRGRV
jgi:2,3-bisphosphoglycerate-independent phosphoglycerate mutase